MDWLGRGFETEAAGAGVQFAVFDPAMGAGPEPGFACTVAGGFPAGRGLEGAMESPAGTD